MTVVDGTTPNAIAAQPDQNPNQAVVPQELVAKIRADAVREIFGEKYEGDVDKAKAGYWELNHTAADAHRLLRERLEAEGRQDPTKFTANREDPWATLNENSMIPMEELRKAVRAEAAAAAETMFTPVVNQLVGHTRLTENLPEYAPNAQKIEAFVAQNPQVASLVGDLLAAGKYEGAKRLAYREWQAATAPSKVDETTINQVSLPNGGNQSRSAPPAITDQEIANLVRSANITGDHQSVYRQIVSSQPILPEHLRN